MADELAEPTDDDLEEWLGEPVAAKPKATQSLPDASKYQDLVPDIDEPEYDNSKYDYAKGIDILEMYRVYCGKMEPKVGSKRESIMVSCPIPGHQDNNPSAYINLDKQVWHCGACGKGGDGIDIARMSLGQDLDDRSSSGFAEAIDAITSDFGFQPPVQARRVPVSEPDPSPTPPPASEAQPGEKATAVTPNEPGVVIRTNEEDVDYDQVWAEFSHNFDWGDIYHPEGFRYHYMVETAQGRLIPHEFHACMADQVLGLGIGRRVVKRESEAVYGNTYACLLGPTGIGKSRAMRPARTILKELLPFSDLTGDGVNILNKPGSGEALITAMEFLDPSGGAGGLERASVRGWLNVDELADVIARAARKGSTLQTSIVEFYSQTDSEVTTHALSSGVHVAFKPYLSIVAGTQPAVLPRLLSDDDLASGFLNRFMFYVATRPEMPAGYSVSEGDPTYDLSNSTSILYEIIEWSKTAMPHQIEVKYTDDARDAVEEVYRYEDLIGVPYERDPIFARLELIFKKLMVLNCADLAVDKITVDNVRRAYDQLKYFVATYSFTAQSMMEDEAGKCLTRLTEVVALLTKEEKWKDGAPLGQVRRKFKDTKYMELLDKVLEHAIATSTIISKQSKPGPGRPTQVLSLP